jgi:hypothetical protein
MKEQTEQEYLNGPNNSGDRRAERTEAAAKGIDAFERELREQGEEER